LEKGDPVSTLDFDPSAVFILGDRVGIPKQEERFVMRFGRKSSPGKQRYLAASCIDILNFVLDHQSLSSNELKR
jgi:tRNA (pseudouridine54-N1)-methyltransferase